MGVIFWGSVCGARYGKAAAEGTEGPPLPTSSAQAVVLEDREERLPKSKGTRRCTAARREEEDPLSWGEGGASGWSLGACGIPGNQRWPHRKDFSS